MNISTRKKRGPEISLCFNVLRHSREWVLCVHAQWLVICPRENERTFLAIANKKEQCLDISEYKKYILY